MNNDEARKLLEMSGELTEQEIDVAFKKQAKIVHPDKNTGRKGDFSRLVSARDFLKAELKQLKPYQPAGDALTVVRPSTRVHNLSDDELWVIRPSDLKEILRCYRPEDWFQHAMTFLGLLGVIIAGPLNGYGPFTGDRLGAVYLIALLILGCKLVYGLYDRSWKKSNLYTVEDIMVELASKAKNANNKQS